MSKLNQRLLTGFIVSLILLIGWEIRATYKYRKYLEDTIEMKKAIRENMFHREFDEAKERAILESKGNPYSLFR